MRRVEFDPGSLATADDPHALLDDLRSEATVAEVAGGFVAVTGHAAVHDALRHPSCRSGPIGQLYLAALPPGAARDEMGHRINFLDAPDHHRVRTIVNSAFTPRRVAALRPWMTTTFDGILDGLAGRTTVDLLADVAHELPSLVISELLGIPADDRSTLTAFSDRVSPLLGLSVTPEDKAAAIDAAEDFHRYLGERIEERRTAPAGDLLSALVTAEADGERLDHAELLSLAATLYSAGHRTTRDAFVNGMVRLLSTGHYAEVLDGRWPLADVVAELLRLDTPTLYVARIPDAPVRLGGVDVPAGSPLLLFLSAANRDPEAYDEPLAFRPGRDGPPALSFAFGAHFCLGAALARSELEVMLSAVTARWPELRLAAPDSISWHLRGPFRGVDRLDVLTR